MENIRVATSPLSGKILIGSTGGSILDAVAVAVDYLNDPANKGVDINFYCDHGGTSVDFPAADRKESYTVDEVWGIVSANRGNRAAHCPSKSSPGPG